MRAYTLSIFCIGLEGQAAKIWHPKSCLGGWWLYEVPRAYQWMTNLKIGRWHNLSWQASCLNSAPLSSFRPVSSHGYPLLITTFLYLPPTPHNHSFFDIFFILIAKNHTKYYVWFWTHRSHERKNISIFTLEKKGGSLQNTIKRHSNSFFSSNEITSPRRLPHLNWDSCTIISYLSWRYGASITYYILTGDVYFLIIFKCF